MALDQKKPKTEIVYRNLIDIKKLENNPRTIKRADFNRLKKSVQDNPEFFEARPLILSDRTGELVVIAGNQRYEAAKALGIRSVPTVLLSGLTEEKEKEIVIRDNIANGEWDMDALANGWDIDKLNNWGVDIKPTIDIREDKPDDVDDDNVYSEEGKIYQLGEHRLYCGSFEEVDRMFAGKKAICTFTDPPYNVAVKSRSTGKTIKNDNMKSEDFQFFLDKAVKCMADHMVPGGGVIAWMSDTEVLTLYNSMQLAGMRIRTLLAWVKNNFTLGGNDFQSAKELAIYALNEGKFDKNALEDDTNEVEWAVYARDGGKFTDSRKVSNVWFFARPSINKDHPTMKPIGLCAKGVLILSDVGDIVFDPFLGSGSTLIACEQTNRKCYGSELDPRYCDVIRKRWYKLVNNTEEGWQEGTPEISEEDL